MNAEKELLLALLIEKHGKPVSTPKSNVVKVKIRRPRRRPTHVWTVLEKADLRDLVRANYSYAEIAHRFNLSKSQVRSAWWNIKTADAKNEANRGNS